MRVSWIEDPCQDACIAARSASARGARLDASHRGGTSMTPRPRVALMIETSTVYGRNLLQGITRYLRSHRSWSIVLEQREVDTVPPGWLRTWNGDGVISRWSTPRVAELLI